MADNESLLFPLLPRAVAEQEYRRLAELPLTVVRDEVATTQPDAVVAPIGGSTVTDAQLERLRERIVAAADAADYPGPSNNRQRAAFDLEAAAVIRDEMLIVPAEAADPDLWAFLGVVLLPDVIFWRFENRPIDRILGTDLTRHTFARLWWRAEQLHDLRSGDGLAALQQIPENAMNQLFERRNIGGNRTLVRALALVLTDLEPDQQEIADRALLRDAIKRVQRLLPFIAFETLDADQVEELVRDVFRQSSRELLGEAAAPPEARPRQEGVEPAEPPPSPAAQEPAKEQPANAEQPTDDEQPLDGVGSRNGGDPESPRRSFESVRLADLTVQITELVQSLGGVALDELPSRFADHYNVDFEYGDADTFDRFAWSARGRGFIEHDEEHDLWLPGSKQAVPLKDFGDWTLAGIRARAADKFAAAPKDDPYPGVLAEVCDAEKPPLLVRRVVGKAVAAARHSK